MRFLSCLSDRDNIIIRFAEIQFGAVKSLLVWYQELPYPKASNQINFNDFGSINQINDASFKLLESITRALDDLKFSMDGALKAVTREVLLLIVN